MKPTWTYLFVVHLYLASCAAPAPTESELVQAATTPPTATVEPAVQPAAQSDVTDETIQIDVSELTFAGQGDTFLEAIASQLRELGLPDERRYLELETTADTLWQGEALVYADRLIVFVQQMRTGSTFALRLETLVTPAPWPTIEASLPTYPVSAALPDVEIVFVRARLSGDTWTFDVTLNHPDTGWEDYVDGWQIETEDGRILGTRILLHPHETEMPFTRSLGGVTLPAQVNRVLIRTHDLVSGYSPDTLTVPLQNAGSGERYEVIRQ